MEQDTNVPISWHVYSKDVQESRALITDDTQLQTACTPNIGGEAVAIWGSHNRSDEPIFNGTLLTYEAKTSTTPHMWNYVDEPDKYWLYSTEYEFLAYYPADFPNVVTTSTLFTATYNSMVQQEDLMLARTTVNTADAAFDKYAPVPLQMNHALAAVTDWENHSDNTASYDWTGTLTFGGTAADVTGYTATSPLATYAENGFILVIPQKDCTPALDIATTDKVYGRVELDKVDFEPGKQYIYTITIDPRFDLSITVVTTSWEKPIIPDITA